MRPNILGDLRSSLRTRLVRNSAFILATALLGYGVGFLFWLLVARVYDPSVVGLSATLLSTILFLATVATLGFPLGLIRFLPQEKDKVGLINASLTAVGIASLVTGLVFVLGIDFWAPTLSSVLADPWVAGICILSLIGFAIAAIIDAAFLGASRTDYGLIRYAIFNLTRLPLPLVFGAMVFAVFAVMLSWTIGLAVSIAAAFLQLLPRLYPKFRFAPSLRRFGNPGVLSYSAWNQATVVVGTAAASLLPLVILNAEGPVSGPSEAAYFYAAFSVASLLYIVPGSFTTSLFIEGSYANATDSTQVRHTVWLSMVLLGLGIVAAVLLGPWILGFFGAGYAQAGYIPLVVLAVASPVLLVNSVLATDLRVAKRVRSLFWITAVSTAVVLVSAYILIPPAGILGAAIGFVLGNTAWVAMFVLDRKLRRRKALRARAGQGESDWRVPR